MLSHFHLYGEMRLSGVMGRRNGTSGLRDDDDDAAETWNSLLLLLHLRLLTISRHQCRVGLKTHLFKCSYT